MFKKHNLKFKHNIHEMLVNNLADYYCDPYQEKEFYKFGENLYILEIDNKNKDIVVISSSNIDRFNNEDIIKIKELYKDSNICLIWFEDNKIPSGIDTFLTNVGLEYHDAYQAMLFDNSIAYSTNIREGYSIETVEHEDHASSFKDVIEKTFDLSTIDSRKYHGLSKYIQEHNKSTMLIVKNNKGEYVATGTVHYEENVAIIDDISVLESERGLGLARSVVYNLINTAKEHGFLDVALYGTPDGFGLYKKMGFEPIDFFMQVYYLENKHVS